MKVHFITIFSLFLSLHSIEAQVGIGTITPDPASVLDIVATDKGVLIPRIVLHDVADTSIDMVNPVPESMLIYNTSTSTLGGSGVGFYFFNGTVWEKLNGTSSGTTDADWFVESTTNVPSSINDNIYTNGNLSIGRQDTPSALNVRTQTETTAVTIDMIVAGDVAQTGTFTRINHTGSDVLYGIRHDLTKDGTGQQIGISQSLSGNTDGIKIGMTNTLSGSGNERFFGIINTISGGGDERKFGVSNSITGNGAGRMFGTSNNVSNNGDGYVFGTSNSVFGTGNHNRFGSSNSVYGSGTGRNYGTNNNVYGTNTGWQIGTSNTISSDADGNNYGVFNSLSGDGDGIHYATYNNISNDGNGAKYGSYSYVNSIGTGTKYGNYILLTTTSQGDHYGLYVDARRTTGTVFAGYFLGNVSIGTTAANNYIFPASRGTAGQIMQIDGAGNLSWVASPAPFTGIPFTSEMNEQVDENTTEVNLLRSEISNLRAMILQQQEQINALSERIED